MAHQNSQHTRGTRPLPHRALAALAALALLCGLWVGFPVVVRATEFTINLSELDDPGYDPPGGWTWIAINRILLINATSLDVVRLTGQCNQPVTLNLNDTVLDGGGGTFENIQLQSGSGFTLKDMTLVGSANRADVITFYNPASILTVEGEVDLTGGINTTGTAGNAITASSSLTLAGSGTLRAKGGAGAANRGGGNGIAAATSLTVDGPVVEATGGTAGDYTSGPVEPDYKGGDGVSSPSTTLTTGTLVALGGNGGSGSPDSFGGYGISGAFIQNGGVARLAGGMAGNGILQNTAVLGGTSLNTGTLVVRDGTVEMHSLTTTANSVLHFYGGSVISVDTAPTIHSETKIVLEGFSTGKYIPLIEFTSLAPPPPNPATLKSKASTKSPARIIEGFEIGYPVETPERNLYVHLAPVPAPQEPAQAPEEPEVVQAAAAGTAQPAPTPSPQTGNTGAGPWAWLALLSAGGLGALALAARQRHGRSL